MKKTLIVPLIAAALLLAGCMVTSVCPFYTDKELAFEPALLGNWQKVVDAKIHWKFEQQGEHAYRLTYSDGDKSWVGSAHAFRLKGELFLDLFAGDKDEDILPPPIPSHYLLRVFQVKSNVRMAALNHDWLADFLDKNPQAIRHHFITNSDKPDERRVILTANTAELQKFILKHLNTEDAWKDSFELKRWPAEEQPVKK